MHAGIGVSNDEVLELQAGLRALALRLVRDAPTADDLVQETWLVALERPRPGVRDLTAWLRGVTRNEAYRHWRRRWRSRERDLAKAARHESPPTDEVAAGRGVLADLARELEGLDEPYRGVVQMRYVDEASLPEIARRLGRPLNTVKSQHRRGLLRLRQKLEHHAEAETWGGVVRAVR